MTKIFFARAGMNDDEEHMGFIEKESFQPYDDLLPPEEEMPGGIDEPGPPKDDEPEPSLKSARTSEMLSDIVSSPTDWGSAAACSPSSSHDEPSLPLQIGTGRKRLRCKAVPAGAWIGVSRPGHPRVESSQPPPLQFVAPLHLQRLHWWESKTERQNYKYVFTHMARETIIKHIWRR